jgi:naphtho-gamma-pyrone polyketide synthase
LNNFSAAGGNTALILEDAPEMKTSTIPDIRVKHMVAVSAKSAVALENNIINLSRWIEKQTDSANLCLARLSYTTTARRMHHPHRVMVVASDLNSANSALQRALQLNEGKSRSKGVPRYVFAFTGQGSQFAGMGMDLFVHFSSFRADICRYDQLCQQLHLPSIRKLFEDQSSFFDATSTMLQLALVSFQMALYRLWLSFGVTPIAVVGHSLGEYAALYAASVLSQADVINLVGQRALLLEKHCESGSHAMLAVRSSTHGLEATLGRSGVSYEVSCHNGPESVVLGGTKAQMESIRPSLQRSRMSHKLLEVC